MSLHIEPYTPPHEQVVLNFIHTQWHIHQHLDWQPIWEWLKKDPAWVYLAMEAGKLKGIIAFSEPYADLVWLRLLALERQFDIEFPQALFEYALPHLKMANIRRIALLQMEAWLPTLLLATEFEQTDYLVHLERRARVPLEMDIDTLIQPATPQDLATVIHLDHVCFAPEWQMQHKDFTAAQQYASHFTLAIQQGRAIGYQLSTTYADGGIHLARLAILPDYRGQRIGTQLVTELVQHFPQHRITVNTQATNTSSLRLYERLQFERRALTTPFWVRYLEELDYSKLR